MPMRTILLGMALGVLVESCAWIMRWWEFRRFPLVVVQIVLVYGLVMGSLAAWVARWPAAVFAVAFLIGLCSELLNLAFLRWWRFPDGRDDRSWMRLAQVVLLALAWGATPWIIGRADAAVASAWRSSRPADPVAELEQRKRYLLEKREALLVRLRDIDRRLRAIDRRQEHLRRRQARATAAPHPSAPAAGGPEGPPPDTRDRSRTQEEQ